MQRKISILEIFEGDKPSPTPLQSQTYHEVTSETSLHFENHPWKTNKTITRLIDGSDSLVNSVGNTS